MSTLLQVLFTGLTTGAIYGLIAMGYALGYSVSGVINFSHGQLLMAAAMIVSVTYGSSLAVGITAGIVVATALGVVVYFVAIWPVVKGGSRGGFSWLVSTLGMAVILPAVFAQVYGTQSRGFPPLLASARETLAGASITQQGLLSIGCVLVLGVALELFRRHSLLGKAATAVAADPEQASAVGVNVVRTHVIAFALAGLLAGLAGVLVGPISYANPYMGAGYGVKGFVALLLGGISNPTAAIGGGFILGIVEAIAAVAIGPSTVDWFPLVILVVVLLVTPYGVFGRAAFKVTTS